MDPATAFQLCCGVVQLIEVGIKTARNVREIWKNSSSIPVELDVLDKETGHLQRNVHSLEDHLEILKAIDGGLDRDQHLLVKTAREGNRLTHDLLTRIDGLKQHGQSRKRDMPSQLLKIQRSKRRIDELSVTLQRKKELLNTSLLVNLWNKINTSDSTQRQILVQVGSVEMQNLKGFESIFQQIQSIKSDIQGQVDDTEQKTREYIEGLHIDSKHDVHIAKLLDSLKFDTMHSRQESISEAYPETYDWIFSGDEHAQQSSNFAAWLETGNDLFWICGKAGSGKSTELMNFIVEHESLLPLLENWSEDRRVIVAKFFFWRAGTKEQKSINGLLRSVLYQLVADLPIFRHAILEKFEPASSAWTDKRLLNALNILNACTMSTSVCFFIDGVDEFEGDEDSKDGLVKIIENISQNQNIKVVVSSRPEPYLVQHFSKFSQLSLQDLTREGMQLYARGKLFNEPNMQLLTVSPSGQKAADKLVTEVCNKADGVFLWTRLAVQDLVSGLRSQDSMVLLRERLRLLNGSLEGLFLQLLKRIHPVHQRAAANCLLYVSERVRKDLSPERVSILHTAIAVDEELSRAFDDILEGESFNSGEYRQCVQKLTSMEVSLVVQSASLLEVSSIREKCEGNTYTELCNWGPKSENDTFRRCLAPRSFHFNHHRCLRFVHRSAFDFLRENDDARAFMSKATISADNMNERVQLAFHLSAKAMIFFVRECSNATGWSPSEIQFRPDRTCSQEIDVVSEEVSLLFITLGTFGALKDHKSRQWHFRNVNEWMTVGAQQLMNTAKHKHQELPEIRKAIAKILDFVGILPNDQLLFPALVHAHAFNVIRSNLTDEHFQSFPHLTFLLLDQCKILKGEKSDPTKWKQAIECLELIGLCVRMGFDPNEPVYRIGRTFWQHFIQWLHPAWFCGRHRDTKSGVPEAALELARVCVEHGANVNAMVDDSWSIGIWAGNIQSSPLDVIQMIGYCLQIDCDELREALVQRGAKCISEGTFSNKHTELQRIYFEDIAPVAVTYENISSELDLRRKVMLAAKRIQLRQSLDDWRHDALMGPDEAEDSDALSEIEEDCSADEIRAPSAHDELAKIISKLARQESLISMEKTQTDYTDR